MVVMDTRPDHKCSNPNTAGQLYLRGFYVSVFKLQYAGPPVLGFRFCGQRSSGFLPLSCNLVSSLPLVSSSWSGIGVSHYPRPSQVIADAKA